MKIDEKELLSMSPICHQSRRKEKTQMAIEYESKKEKFNTEEGDTMKLPAELGRNFDNQSVFQVCLRGCTPLFPFSKVNEDYWNREIKNAIADGWCALHTDHREPFIKGTAIDVEQCNVQNGGKEWTCSFHVRIKEPFHGLYIRKCLEHAGEYRGIGEGTPHLNYGRFRVESMEPIAGNGNS